MSEVRLVVRGADCDWSGTIHGSCADRAVAALSADPITTDELETAMERFAKRAPQSRFLVNLSPGLYDEPHDAGLVAIDLIARLIVVDSTYSSPGRDGFVYYQDGQCATEIGIRYHLADDWLISNDCNDWKHRATERRRDAAAKPIRDARQVLYGRPMLEFVASESFGAFARRDEISAIVRAQWAEAARNRAAAAGLALDWADTDSQTDGDIAPTTWPGQERYADPFYDTLKQIHAAWLLTARDDLGGACPREVVLDRHNHLTWDLQDRCEQWSAMGECPPSLADSSQAFRYAGFGTHELVMYYKLVRELLWSCWEQLTGLAQAPTINQTESLMVGDFLITEVPRLEQFRETWLDAPSHDFHGRTPRSIITHERARLPEGGCGHEAIIDPDCPCCQMLADMPGPMFWHLDGSGMDDEFAFDITWRSREEYDAEQRRWEEFNRRFDAESAERKHLGVSSSAPGEDGSGAVWSRSFAVADSADVPLGIRVFGVGCHLAELIVGLRDGADREMTPAEAQQHIDQLNRDFGNLRDVLQSSDASLFEALLAPVVQRFAETLDAVATNRLNLAAKCESLADDLHKLLDPPSEESWNSPDAEFPF